MGALTSGGCETNGRMFLILPYGGAFWHTYYLFTVHYPLSGRFVNRPYGVRAKVGEIVGVDAHIDPRGCA